MVTEKKLDAAVYFYHFSRSAGMEQQVGEKCSGLVHLFEHPYNESVAVVFWYGVVDVVGIPRNSFPRREWTMVLEFEDGRQGTARQVTSTTVSGPDDEYVRIAFVGVDDLRIPE